VGDEDFQRKCLEHMYELRRNGVTIVVVSHSLPLVQMLCDEAIWLDHGRVLAAGTSAEVVRTYTDHVTASEVGRHRSAADAESTDGIARGGAGGLRMVHVAYLDPGWHVVPHMTTGAPHVIRLFYSAEEAVENPVWTFDLVHERGEVVASHSTQSAGKQLGTLGPGQGFIDCVIDRFPLNPGSYYLASYLTDETGMRTYDRVHRCCPFTVRSADPGEHRGLVRMDGSFTDATTVELDLSAAPDAEAVPQT
jgi:ABC-2 type transport system ATP-binding protein/lipopolysaccharide transport system ATP-binding protein